MKRLDYERRSPSLRGHARNPAEAVMFLAAVARERHRLGQERHSLEKRLKRIDARLTSIAVKETQLSPIIRGDRPAAGVMARPLEVAPSGVQVDLGRGVRFEPRLTFARQDKAWCRQYTLSYLENLEAGGVACRNSAGAWQVLIETGRTAPAPPPSPMSHLPAGPLPSDGEGILDSVRSQLKKGDVLGREEEAKRIAEHWKKE